MGLNKISITHNIASIICTIAILLTTITTTATAQTLDFFFITHLRPRTIKTFNLSTAIIIIILVINFNPNIKSPRALLLFVPLAR